MGVSPQHEIRGYNRLGMMARSELLVMMQDDDVPRAHPDWLRNATRLFAKYPRMGMLGVTPTLTLTLALTLRRDVKREKGVVHVLGIGLA